VFGDWWGWEKHVEDFQRPDFKAFAKYVASLPLRPRTQDNYLRNVCTFFRAAGRVVEIVRNEQDATLAARKTTLPNTLFLVSRDFPTVNKGMADYYSDAQIEGLFAGAVNPWERLMLSMFYYTGMREAEVSHLYWSNVNWEAEEIEVKEKPEWDWTSKSSVDRMVEAPPQLMEVLREAYAGRGTSKLIFPNQLNHPEGHFLDAVQKIAYRAKITCGECPNCMEHKGRNCHVSSGCTSFGTPMAACWTGERRRSKTSNSRSVIGTSVRPMATWAARIRNSAGRTSSAVSR